MIPEMVVFLTAALQHCNKKVNHFGRRAFLRAFSAK